MPGMVGFLSVKTGYEAEARLAQMLLSLRSHDFDVTGTWIDESLGVYVAWTAHEGSFSEKMPIRNEQGNITLVFSGEEYSEADTIARPQNAGHAGSTLSPHYLLRHYESDPEFPVCLNGMFHGIVVDGKRGVATLFNDRYGMHRLCYHKTEDCFYFASEAKAILAVRPELRQIDPQSIGEFISCSCVLEDRTIFKNIHVLPAASAWTFRRTEIVDKRTYFNSREWEQQEQLPAETYYQELRDVVQRMLPKYFAGQQHAGIAITGGLDTRVILSQYSSSPKSLKSYTFGGPFRESRDASIGRKLAGICQHPYQIINVNDSFLDNFSNYAERCIEITEGTVDVHRAADLYLSEKVRAIAPAKIVGTYGSEIMRNAVMFKPLKPQEGLFCPEFVDQIGIAVDTYAELRKQHPVTFAAFRQSPWYHHGILALEQSQLTVRSPFMDNDFVRTAYRAPQNTAANGDVRLRLIGDGNRSLASITSDRGVGGNKGAVISKLMRAFQEFTFKAEYAYDYGMPQWAARVDHWLSWVHLERLFLGRHKLLHYRIWYRDRLADYVRQILLDPLTLSRPYLQKKTVETIVEGHLRGNHNHTMAIHKLLTLELLHRRFLDAR